jgi:hypothetical protein
MRGMGKDQAMDGSHAQSYQTITVGLLNEECTRIDVGKYTWPISDFEKRHSTRELTHENVGYMLFKNDSEKRNHPNIQKLLDG